MRIEFYSNFPNDWTGKEELANTRNVIDQLNEYSIDDLHKIHGIRKGATAFDSLYFINHHLDENYTVKVGVSVTEYELIFSVSSTKEIEIMLRDSSVKKPGISISGKKFTFTM